VRVLTITVTERGREMARRLPFEHLHGHPGQAVRQHWTEVDGFVLVLAVGAAVRIIAPLLSSKEEDPAVVCLDDAARYAVALCGGHGRRAGAGVGAGARTEAGAGVGAGLGAGVGLGANQLARQVAEATGAEAVVTTASEAAGLPALDALPGVVASGDVAGVMRAMLDGARPSIDNPLDWPLPAPLRELAAPDGRGAAPPRIIVTDLFGPEEPGVARLHPPSLVVGLGASSTARPCKATSLLNQALAGAGLAPASVVEVATIDKRAGHPVVECLGRPVRSFPAAALAQVPVPHPSPAVDEAVGTPSVAEAAALLAAGPGASLVVPKQVGSEVTVAVARRRRPRGHLSVVGLGPGHPVHRTPAAERAVRRAEVVIGYELYLEQCRDLLSSGQEVAAFPIGDEVGRADASLTMALAGRRVALVSSGDPGLYAMASLVCERADQSAARGGPEAHDLDLEIVPGVSAGQAAAALLGAPLGHDHAVISLSDLLTPWATIAARVEAAGNADLPVVLYNPRSTKRTWQLPAALEILGRYRSPHTPVGLATDVARPGQAVAVTTLASLDPEQVGMTSCVIVGSSQTKVVRGRMVTPRGYRP
jgi:cobalt-precorrin 5A hydrolase/precorrin-3B C17-methyltransferase